MSQKKMIVKKYFVSLLLAVSMLITGMPPMMVFASSDPTPDISWYVGNPNAASFVVTTADQLAGLAILVDSFTPVPDEEEMFGSLNVNYGDDFNGKTITLGNDIDLSAYGASWDGGKGWEPIGDQYHTFKGTFDGAGYKIRNLYINGAGESGLFGVIDSATISNLGIVDASITSGAITGCLSGMSQRSDITNCYATGSVTGTHKTGGLLGGVEYGGSVSGSYFSGSVGGTQQVGGLIGYVSDSLVVKDCFTSGSVNGTSSYIGGLLGRSGLSGWPGVNISYSFSTASVTGSNTVGGLVGIANTSGNGSVTSCAALNAYVKGDAPVGRIIAVADNYPKHQLNGNVALENMPNNGGGAFSGENAHDGLDGGNISETEASSQAFWTTIIGLDSNVWQITDGAFPTLKITSTPTTVTPAVLTVAASTTTGKPGEEVEITISLEKNPGIAGFNMVLGYNSAVLTPLAVTKNTEIGGSVFASNVNEIEDKSTLSELITVVWASNYDVDVEELFTIRFRINDISIGDNETIIAPVTVTVKELKYLSRADAYAEWQDGSVKVSRNGGEDLDDLLWGDVNVDGIVNINDLIRFAKHSAVIPGETLTDEGLTLADVDRNDSVDLGDIILIARYLGSEDMEKPDVTLGISQ